METRMTPEWLFDKIVGALAREDRELRRLLHRRDGYESYAPGIAAAYETGAVYAVFKTLVTSLPKEWLVEWESSHGTGYKKIDLVLLHRRTRVRWGIEVKWWSKGGYGIADDCAKLLAAKGVARRFILVLAARPAEGGCWALPRLINRSRVKGRLNQYRVELLHEVERNAYGRSGAKARLGIALIEVPAGVAASVGARKLVGAPR